MRPERALEGAATLPTEQEFAQKFLGDEAFRAEFKKDPKATMRAHGVDVPDGIEIEVVESTPAKHFIVMPPLQTEELTDDQLSAAQGAGAGVYYTMYNCAGWRFTPSGSIPQ